MTDVAEVKDERSWASKAYDASIRPLVAMPPRTLATQILNLLLVVCTALMIWKTFMITTGSDSPVVVVLSGSMEPTFYKGDILFLNLGDKPFEIGETVVFKIPGREIPIVHRILEVHDREDGDQDILTKGDNNDGFDRPLYSGQTWIRRDQILGRARALLPHVGHLTILMSEFPVFKYLLLGVMGFFVLTAKGE